MPVISIVIVNYNTPAFLHLCLESVEHALSGLSNEVFIVDNNSTIPIWNKTLLRFTSYNFIFNKKNSGYAVANNMALRMAQGEYCLLLNPDVILSEDTLQLVLNRMQNNNAIGACGVKLCDGSGRYLQESKRGLPTPFTAFCKASGLTALFPESKSLARYYLGHLSKNIPTEIEILVGAFMMIRKEALQKSGLLDETFFMYGEDIDLSYRILKSGYKIWYEPTTTAIHFKGESTSKKTIKYLRDFYRAMEIFSEKHFPTQRVAMFFLKTGIRLRAIFSLQTLIKSDTTTLPVFNTCYFVSTNLRKAPAFGSLPVPQSIPIEAIATLKSGSAIIFDSQLPGSLKIKTMEKFAKARHYYFFCDNDLSFCAGSPSSNYRGFCAEADTIRANTL